METQDRIQQELAIERFGWITKEEPLSCITDTNLQLNICILEAVSPFFGYYADEPRTGKPLYLYWVLDKHYSFEHLERTFEFIRRNCNHHLECAAGQVTIVNETYPVVRMLNLGLYNQITTVQQMFEKMDIHLKKSTRKIQNQMGLIKLNKFLHLEKADKGLYLDQDNEHRGFFEIPRDVNWMDFKNITTQVKYDTTLIFFDAARAAFREKGKIVELVRIYRENLTQEKLMAIRERYLRLITA